ncbi:hypothetical protein RSOLAG22IIIB_13061 [Rhizoctonia solani]|uniref:BTB domain-containing protein n=1 Tax=Rhizoctonia solani TaxID=456999 RepID=A0A0K6GIF8_9AGAM|nr:hypothetical protein RSOLAG22IIIB_13061 [Rhizoctonia solani]
MNTEKNKQNSRGNTPTALKGSLKKPKEIKSNDSPRNEGNVFTESGSMHTLMMDHLPDTTRSKTISLYTHSPSNEKIRWLDFQTSDLQVAETEVFRLHQEILAAHSTFFREQLQVSVEKEELVIAPRAGDVPVVVLREICVDAFVNAISLIYPPPGVSTRRVFTRMQAEGLLQTAHKLGMPGVIQVAMESLANDHNLAPISLFEYATRYNLFKWQLRSVRELVYRTRPLSDDEALVLGTVTTAQIARLREIWRAGIFARFEPVQTDGLVEPKPHRSGEDSDLVRWSALGKAEEGRLELGGCQRAMLEALKVVFSVDGPKSEVERYIIQEEHSVMRNLAEWLRLGRLGGGTELCRGCIASIDRAVRVYCLKDEMDVQIEREIGGSPEAVEQPFFDC